VTIDAPDARASDDARPETEAAADASRIADAADASRVVDAAGGAAMHDAPAERGVSTDAASPDGDVPWPATYANDRGGGCGCRVHAAPSPANAAPYVLALAALALRRKTIKGRSEKRAVRDC